MKGEGPAGVIRSVGFMIMNKKSVYCWGDSQEPAGKMNAQWVPRAEDMAGVQALNFSWNAVSTPALNVLKYAIRSKLFPNEIQSFARSCERALDMAARWWHGY